jgi:hypothetical protein
MILVVGTAYLLRAATVVMTVLPFSYVPCEAGKPADRPLLVDAFYLLLMLRKSCGDVFFSGHTILYTIGFLAMQTYPIHFILTGLAFVQYIISLLILIASAYHYSIDVLVSALVVSLLWWSFHVALALEPLLYPSQSEMDLSVVTMENGRQAGRGRWNLRGYLLPDEEQRPIYPTPALPQAAPSAVQTTVELGAVSVTGSERSSTENAMDMPLLNHFPTHTRHRRRVVLGSVSRFLIRMVLIMDGSSVGL